MIVTSADEADRWEVWVKGPGGRFFPIWFFFCAEVHYWESVIVHVGAGGKSERSKRARGDEIIPIISGHKGSRTSICFN